jgi:hypothetical protein
MVSLHEWIVPEQRRSRPLSAPTLVADDVRNNRRPEPVNSFRLRTTAAAFATELYFVAKAAFRGDGAQMPRIRNKSFTGAASCAIRRNFSPAAAGHHAPLR